METKIQELENRIKELENNPKYVFNIDSLMKEAHLTTHPSDDTLKSRQHLYNVAFGAGIGSLEEFGKALSDSLQQQISVLLKTEIQKSEYRHS